MGGAPWSALAAGGVWRYGRAGVRGERRSSGRLEGLAPPLWLSIIVPFNPAAHVGRAAATSSHTQLALAGPRAQWHGRL